CTEPLMSPQDISLHDARHKQKHTKPRAEMISQPTTPTPICTPENTTRKPRRGRTRVTEPTTALLPGRSPSSPSPIQVPTATPSHHSAESHPCRPAHVETRFARRIPRCDDC